MNGFLTFADAAKRLNPDQTAAEIIESMNQSNPIMQHIGFIPGTSLTGNTTTVRTEIPMPEYRRINRGVGNVKSDVKQVTDTLSSFEIRSTIDVKQLKIHGDNAKEFRRQEDAALAEGFGQMIAKAFFYGDSSKPDQFDGIATRYSAFSDEKHTTGNQLVNAGGTTDGKLTSVWFVGFSPTTVTGFYPKNGTAGLQIQDLGEHDVVDKNDATKMYRGVTTLMNWDVGLSVRDIRYISGLRNIDTTKLKSFTAGEKLKLMELLTYAKNRLHGLDSGNKQFRMYVSDAVYDFLEVYELDKGNITVTTQTLANGIQQRYFRGIPVYRMDCLSNEENIIV